MKNFIFRNATETDFASIKQLCDLRFGSGYFDRDTFGIWSCCPEFFKVAYHQNNFVGYAVMIPATYQEIGQHMKMTTENVSEIAQNKPALIYKSLSVCKEYEKLGIPLAFSELLIDTAHKLGFGTIFASAWVFNGKMPIAKMFEKLDFKPLFLRHMLWYDDKRYHCVICGGNCKCDAMIYYKNI